MKYKNISGRTLEVPYCGGSISVPSDEFVLTAKKYGAPFVEAGELEVVPVPASKSKKSTGE